LCPGNVARSLENARASENVRHARTVPPRQNAEAVTLVTLWFRFRGAAQRMTLFETRDANE
jgi:hypothetical protein